MNDDADLMIEDEDGIDFAAGNENDVEFKYVWMDE